MDKNKNNIGIFSGPIWEGTYYSFQDVPCTGDAFVEEDKWMESCQRQIQDIQASGCRYQEYLLPVIGAMVANENDKNNKNNLVVPLCVNIDVASNKEVNYGIFKSSDVSRDC